MTNTHWRVIAQRILTGDFLSWDVPLVGSTHTRELSGPGGISGSINPELRHVLADDGRPMLEEWSTALYVEESGVIRGGGIIQSLAAEGSSLTVSAPGFCSYCNGVPITKEYTPVDFEDPATVFENLWASVQSFPDANLGMTVNAPNTYLKLSGGAGPYKVSPWEYKDYGAELNSIATTAPFDYLERHEWNGAGDAITHTLDVGFPRLGRKRDDLRFAESENIVSFAAIGADGDRFANEVHLLGSGEGRDMPVQINAVRDGRLRRPTVVSRKAATEGLARTYAAQERRSRELKLDIAEVQIKDHPNAPISAIKPGDDVLTELEVPWYGELRLWLRVLSVEESVDNPGRATLKTQRSDYFTYAADTNPNPDGAAVVVII